jgi:hypothetical protein
MPLGRQSNDSLAANANHVRILHLAVRIDSKLENLSSALCIGSALTGRDKTANT